MSLMEENVQDMDQEEDLSDLVVDAGNPKVLALDHDPSLTTVTQWDDELLENCIKCIVSIRVCYTRSFEGSRASYSYATGFIVDKVRGIICTNRHVMSTGPITADAIFPNKEEMDLTPLYRDPVHDFAFFKFDPSKVKFQSLGEIELYPDGARVGVEIRVIGNDAGEKISILPGILARLDREAPYYGQGHYSDFNTFYFVAASSSSGGSSGSPVLSSDGRAVALNCGAAKKAASSFFFPLHRVERALRILQAGTQVPSRGTLRVVLKHLAFDEVLRLGLPKEREALVRNELSDETGMLVCDQVIHGGTGEGKIEPGDILLSVNGQTVTTFVPLEEALDGSVGGTIALELQRGGHGSFSVTVAVEDLHSITPTDFIEISSACIHPLSYIQAKSYSMPCGLVYLAHSGYMLHNAGVPSNCILTGLGDADTPNMAAFERALSNYPHGISLSIRFITFHDRHRSQLAVLRMDRRFFPALQYRFDPPSGLWYPSPLQEPLLRPPSLQVPLELAPPAATDVRNTMVLISFTIPYHIEGLSSGSFVGVGTVVDVEKGLVVCDRNTVPIALGDVRITLNGMKEVSGRVLVVHPVHNFSIVALEDPSQLLENGMSAAVLSTEMVSVGQGLDFFGLTQAGGQVMQGVRVAKIERLRLKDPKPPQFRASNVEVMHFDRTMTSCAGGVFCSAGQKLVAAFFFSFAYVDNGERRQIFRGLPAFLVANCVNLYQQHLQEGDLGLQGDFFIQSLPAELATMEISKARAGMGLSEGWCSRLLAKVNAEDAVYGGQGGKNVLMVKRCMAGTPASAKLETGDILLTINGEVVMRPWDVEFLVQNSLPSQALAIRVLRQMSEHTLSVEPSALPTIGASRVVIFAGLMLIESNLPVRAMGFVPPEGGIYICRWSYGSPAHKYGLRATAWIVEVNERPTPTLDHLLDSVRDLEPREGTRLKLVDTTTKVKISTLRNDQHYWPLQELRLVAGEWQLATVGPRTQMESSTLQ